MKPDYNNCVTNLANSILKEFGLKTFHNSLSDVDKLLEKDYENIIVLLLDGMGSKILDKTLDKTDFLQANKLKDITSVLPSTTTASTISIMSGLNPVEHGWLGWDLYFEDLNETITLFRNTIKDSNKKTSVNYNVANEKLGYTSIVERINNETDFKAYGLFPFGNGKYETRKQLYTQLVNITKIEGKKYIYAYIEEPDHSMHELGTSDIKIKELIKTINEEIIELSDKLKNTLLIITADHGHLDSTPIILKEYKDIYNTLERTTGIEPRCTSFKVKTGKQQEFEKLFNQYFKDDFILYTKEEVIKQELFGQGDFNKYFKSAIGDYLAIATKDKYINYDEKGDVLKSMHAGITEDEMLIPLICISKKDDPKEGFIREANFKDYSKFKRFANKFQEKYAVSRRDIFFKTATYCQNEFFKLCIQDDDTICLFYMLNEEIIGFIEGKVTSTDGKRLYNYQSILTIERIMVKEEYRRQKVGTKLYEAIYKYAKKRKINRIEIKVYNFSPEAIEFLKSINMSILSYQFEMIVK